MVRNIILIAFLCINNLCFSQSEKTSSVTVLTNTVISMTLSPVPDTLQFEQAPFINTYKVSDSLNTTFNFNIDLKTKNITLKNPYNGKLVFSINYSKVFDLKNQEGIKHDLNFHFNDKMITQHGQVLSIRYIIDKKSVDDVIFITFIKDDNSKSRQWFKVTKPTVK